MYFFDAASRGYGAPAFPQSQSQAQAQAQAQAQGPHVSFYPYPEAHPQTPRSGKPQPPLFAMPPPPPSVIAAPLNSPGLMWAPTGMYAPPQSHQQQHQQQHQTAAIIGGHDTSTGMPVFISQPQHPLQQQQQQQQLSSAASPSPGGPPLVYMLTPVAMPQPYNTQHFQPATPQDMQNQNMTPFMPHLMMHEIMTPITHPSNMIPNDEMWKRNSVHTPDTVESMDSSKTKVDVNVVCRHFMNSCCNRRKCRFLHTPSDSSLPAI